MAKDKAAGGIEAVVETARAAARAGLSRALPALRMVNQPRGFDCPGCAWPEEQDRRRIAFCESGAKAVSHEATRRKLTSEFFLSWPIPRLLEQSDRWLEAQGRLVEPLIQRSGQHHYEPISWQDALARAGEQLRALASPNEAVFYTSGRASNEAAFLYQLFVREFGTNNLPDCSNLCHESSGTGLTEVIGFGKGTVGLEDFAMADLILVIGQNPGSNHPRMLATLQRAARRGCHIVSINPLRERGLVRFRHPQQLSGILGRGTPLAERFVQVKLGGDIALLKGVMKELLALDAERPAQVLDHEFIRLHTQGFDEFRRALEGHGWTELEALSGVSREQMRELAELYARSERSIACWAMGLTQHAHGVDNVQEVMNLLLLRGNVGKPGAGPCPVRGHSNVQGDRSMGIWERPKPALLDALDSEFGISSPREAGMSSVEATHALHDGDAKVFVALGGNFARATPDTPYTEEALRRARLTVNVATRLNRTHLVGGRESLLLPCLTRSERDPQRGGLQFVTVEDSMACVHRSQGRLAPASPALRSETAIVAGLARATLRDDTRIPWEELISDYDRIRDRIARVIPGFEDFNERVRAARGFVLPRPPGERRFDVPGGRALFKALPVPDLTVPPGHLLLMTVRSHDQYNTTIYSDDDRYRNVRGNRRVVLLCPEDMKALDLAEGARVDLTSHFRGEAGKEECRSVRGFQVLPYDTPAGCAVSYFPEANPLVPVGQMDARSRTPAYKSVEISIRAAE